jgi:hypothetical protein
LGYGFVTTLRVPTATAVTTADVQAQSDVSARQPCYTGVVGRNRLGAELIWIDSTGAELLPGASVEVVGVERGIQLHIGHTFGEQRLDLAADDSRNLVE